MCLVLWWKETLLFNLLNCQPSIPNYYDGINKTFFPTQRKIFSLHHPDPLDIDASYRAQSFAQLTGVMLQMADVVEL